MSLLIPVSWGELLDKIAILQIKAERITDTEKLRNIHHELDLLVAVRDREISHSLQLEGIWLPICDGPMNVCGISRMPSAM